MTPKCRCGKPLYRYLMDLSGTVEPSERQKIWVLAVDKLDAGWGVYTGESVHQVFAMGTGKELSDSYCMYRAKHGGAK